MKQNVMIFVFFCVLLMCFGIIKTRSGMISSGSKIIKLQKELWHLKDINDKLKNEYQRIVTSANLIKKNEELNLSLVPPKQVIFLTKKQK